MNRVLEGRDGRQADLGRDQAEVPGRVGEWGVLVDFHEEGEDLIDGVVFDHGRDRDALCKRLKQSPNPVAIEYTGQITGGLFGLYTFDVDPED